MLWYILMLAIQMYYFKYKYYEMILFLNCKLTLWGIEKIKRIIAKYRFLLNNSFINEYIFVYAEEGNRNSIFTLSSFYSLLGCFRNVIGRFSLSFTANVHVVVQTLFDTLEMVLIFHGLWFLSHISVTLKTL